MTAMNAEFGLLVKAERVRLKMSQEELAEKVGMSRFQIIRIEKGESGTTPETAKAIARVLQINEGTALRLAGYNGDPAPTVGFQLAERIERALMRIPPSKRERAAQSIEQHAQTVADLLSA